MTPNNLHLPRSILKCSVNKSTNTSEGFILKSIHNTTYSSTVYQKEVIEKGSGCRVGSHEELW